MRFSNCFLNRVTGSNKLDAIAVDTLQALTLSPSSPSFTEGDPEGTLIASIQNLTDSSAVALATADSHIEIVGVDIKVGSTASDADDGDITFSLVETKAGATGSPKTSGPYTISVLTAVVDDGSYGNDGTESVPGGAVEVSGTTQLSSAIAARGTDTVIHLAPGDYGAWNFNASNYNGLTLIGQQGVLFKNILVSGDNLTLSYMDLYRGQDNVTIPAGQYGIAISSGANNVTIDHIGMKQGTVITARCTGIYIRGSTNITISHCDLDGVGNGIAGQGDAGDGTDCNNITITDCSIQKYVENGIFFQTIGNLRVERVRIRNYDLSSGGHADLLQLTNIFKISGGIEDGTSGNFYACIVQDCYGDVSTGFDDPSGILGQVQSVAGLLARRVCSFCSSYQGMGLAGLTETSLIDDCFMQGRDDASYETPISRILVRGQSTNVTVQNTTAGHFDTTDTPAPTNLTPDISEWNQSTISNGNTIIANAANGSDRTDVDAWLALHTNVPHW